MIDGELSEVGPKYLQFGRTIINPRNDEQEGMSNTPKAIQDLLDELEASKQSRLHA
jgi:hypothetical protein